MEKKNCELSIEGDSSLLDEQSEADRLIDEEIMKEILAEEEARKKLQDSTSKKNIKGSKGKGKKKGKGKGKGKKSSNKDEL